jgi:hypothetical protein
MSTQEKIKTFRGLILEESKAPISLKELKTKTNVTDINYPAFMEALEELELSGEIQIKDEIIVNSNERS